MARVEVSVSVLAQRHAEQIENLFERAKKKGKKSAAWKKHWSLWKWYYEWATVIDGKLPAWPHAKGQETVDDWIEVERQRTKVWLSCRSGRATTRGDAIRGLYPPEIEEWHRDLYETRFEEAEKAALMSAEEIAEFMAGLFKQLPGLIQVTLTPDGVQIKNVGD